MLDANGGACVIDWGLAEKIATKQWGAGTAAFMPLRAHIENNFSIPADDVESSLYIGIEMLLRTKAIMRGEAPKACEDTYLPWDLAAEEMVVAWKKKSIVQDPAAKVWKPPCAAQAVQECLRLVWSSDESSLPPYKAIGRSSVRR